MIKKYELREANPVDKKRFPKGSTAYDYMGCDYGCSSDDSRILGEEYITITDQADGSGPFNTCPSRLLKEIT